MAVDLSSLPTPQVIEEVSFEEILARKKAKFQQLWTAIRAANPSLPAYDVAMLETDPVIILLQSDAYDEMLLRALANSVARSNLLGFAIGANLDALAADHGVTRLTGESDEALRQRIILHDQGSSAAGSEEWYAYHARTASVLVEDAVVYRSNTSSGVTIAILATNNGGVPTQGLLDAVYAIVNSPSVRAVGDVISVVAATTQAVNVSAEVWLLPDAPVSVFDGLEDTLSAAFLNSGGIGFDINRSWLVSKLMVPGVSKVEIIAPASDVVVNGNSAAALGTVNLVLKGRSR